jgi:hypothetical protein
MYLEISGRRSGKSYRLAQEVRKQVEQGYNCVIISPTYDIGQAIYRKLFSHYSEVKICSIEHFQNRNNKWGEVPERFFFDEFDMYSKQHQIPIYEDGYYCTTAHYVRSIDQLYSWKANRRTDKLLELVKANNNNFETYNMGFTRAELKKLAEANVVEDYVQYF